MVKLEIVTNSVQDWADYFNISHNEVIRDYCSLFYSATINDAKRKINTFILDKSYLLYKILEDHLCVGYIILIFKDYEVEVECCIGKKYRNKGYCEQACTEIKLLLKNVELPKVLFVHPSNSASISVAEKISYRTQKLIGDTTGKELMRIYYL